jgi:hypothetical protein
LLAARKNVRIICTAVERMLGEHIVPGCANEASQHVSRDTVWNRVKGAARR